MTDQQLESYPAYATGTPLTKRVAARLIRHLTDVHGAKISPPPPIGAVGASSAEIMFVPNYAVVVTVGNTGRNGQPPSVRLSLYGQVKDLSDGQDYTDLRFMDAGRAPYSFVNVIDETQVERVLGLIDRAVRHKSRT